MDVHKSKQQAELDNPYADFGSIVHGERFIGRFRELTFLQERVLGRVGFGSVIIYGLPRTGKSSLAWNAFVARKDVLSERGLIPVRVEVGLYASRASLLQDIARDMANELVSCGLMSAAIERRLSEALWAADAEQFRAFRELFCELVRSKLRPIIILDEFDAARYVLKEGAPFFHWLREIASNPLYKVALILIARRGPSDIARMAGFSSGYWSNVFHTLPVGLFDDADQEIFFENLGKFCHGFFPEGRTRIQGELSGHPFLMDAFAFEAVNGSLAEGGEDALRFALMKAKEVFRDVHEVAKDTGLLGKVIQTLVGPQCDVTSDDVLSMEECGIIRIEDGRFVPFVPSFRDYLECIQYEIEIWPLWRETETSLRSAIADRLVLEFGEGWPERVKSRWPALRAMIERCEYLLASEVSKLGPRASQRLLDYSYPQDLWSIIRCDWPKLGEPIFGAGARKQEWSAVFERLAQVRAPLAHNRVEPLLISQARLDCERILSCLAGGRD